MIVSLVSSDDPSDPLAESTGLDENDIMSSITLRIAGSIHEGNERFSEESRGRQCAFMSLTALLFAQRVPISLWDTDTR
ncbi:hypothetical protein QZH41_010996 [Actinostola sp. cb2023]|nr:hypothetical protein QZH41_010996 [Actinostola sp. cb2023]